MAELCPTISRKLRLLSCRLRRRFSPCNLDFCTAVEIASAKYSGVYG